MQFVCDLMELGNKFELYNMFLKKIQLNNKLPVGPELFWNSQKVIGEFGKLISGYQGLGEQRYLISFKGGTTKSRVCQYCAWVRSNIKTIISRIYKGPNKISIIVRTHKQ